MSTRCKYGRLHILCGIGLLSLLIAFLSGCGGGNGGNFVDRTVRMLVGPHPGVIPLGETVGLKLLAYQSDGSVIDESNSAIWTSSNEEIATVTDDGVVHSHKMGKVVITGTVGGMTALTAVKISNAALLSLVISTRQSSLPLGLRTQMTATGTYTDGSTEDLTTTVTWKSSQSDIASVDATGLLISKAIGSTTIYGVAGTISGAAEISIAPPAVASIAVNTSHSSVPLGLTQQFNAIATFTDGSTQDLTSAASWKTSDANIAVAGVGGIVSSKSAGSAAVYASSGDVTGSSQLTVLPAALASLAISSSRLAIPLGASQQLIAQGTYTDGTALDLTHSVAWSSSLPNIVSIGNGGVVMAKATGSAVVSATLGSVAATNQITVTSAALVALTVTSTRLSVPLGLSQSFGALGSYSDGGTQDLTNSVSWRSAQPDIAAISGDGVVITKALGISAISASSGNITGASEITVLPAELTSLIVNTARSRVPLGLTQQFNAVGTFTDGTTKDLTNSVSWQSSQPNVGVVDANGVVTTKSAGISTINASTGSMTATGQLTVIPAALSTVIVTASPTPIPVGLTQQLNAKGTYTDGSTQDVTSSATWSSTPAGIVSVSTTGVATGIGVGSASVQAQLGPIGNQAKIIISAPVVQSIAVVAPSAVMPLGSNQRMTAQATYSDGSIQDASSAAVWISDAPSIASIDASGNATAISEGNALISASVSGVLGSMEMSVSAPSLSSIQILPADPTILLGNSMQLQAVGSYTDGSTQDITAQALWSADSSDIIQMADSGQAFGEKVGSSGIEAALSGVTSNATLVVEPLALVGYFTNRPGQPDTTLRVSDSSDTTLCAMIYVFDQDQQMAECCGCTVTPDGLRTISVTKDLNANPLTGVASTAGSVMVVPADYATSASCDASSMTPDGLGNGWATHVQVYPKQNFTFSETPLSQTALAPTQTAALQAQCGFIQQLGSGQGICHCGTGE